MSVRKGVSVVQAAQDAAQAWARKQLQTAVRNRAFETSKVPWRHRGEHWIVEDMEFRKDVLHVTMSGEDATPVRVALEVRMRG